MPSTVRLNAQVRWLPKGGHEVEEYEDAAFVTPNAVVPPLWAAVADGATESAYAGVWADHLVRGFVAARPTTPQEVRDALPSWRRAWLRDADTHADAAPWYAEHKRDEGAFATLLGLHVASAGRFQAFAVGDCVLFHLREGEVLAAWPLDHPAAFSNQPALLCSRPGRPEAQVAHLEGRWQPGDTFALASDALAAWLLTEPTRLPGLVDAPPSRFRQRMLDARTAGALRNDDTTLLVLHLRRV